MASSQATIIADPKELGGDVIILLGDRRFAVSGPLKKGLREALLGEQK